MAKAEEFFPLKLVDFEHYMLFDDGSPYPMVIRGELDFKGTIDRQLLDRALQLAAIAHPLFRSRIEKQGDDYYWVLSRPPKVEWNCPLPKLEPIDARHETCFKLFGQQSGDRIALRFFVHHAVTDGAGLIRFLEHWLIVYHNLASSSDDVPVPESDLAALPSRGRFQMNFWKYLLRPFQEFCGLAGVTEFFANRPVALGPQTFDESLSPESEPDIDFFDQRFTPAETMELRKRAKALKCTVNDLLLSAIYDSAQQYLNQHQPENSDRPIRIMIPVDMRTRYDSMLPACNCVTMVFLDRRPKKSRDFSNILWWVRLEMGLIKRIRSGLTMIHLIRVLKRFGRLGWLLRRDRSIASTVASNMGPIFHRCPLAEGQGFLKSGDLTLQAFSVYPPVRPFTWASVVVTTYAGAMNIHCAFARAAIDRSQAGDFVTRIREGLLGVDGDKVDGVEKCETDPELNTSNAS